MTGPTKDVEHAETVPETVPDVAAARRIWAAHVHEFEGFDWRRTAATCFACQMAIALGFEAES